MTSFLAYISNVFALYILQVIKAFGNAEFFNLVFPLLFDMSNSAALHKSRKTNLGSDTNTEGGEISSSFYLNTKTYLSLVFVKLNKLT